MQQGARRAVIELTELAVRALCEELHLGGHAHVANVTTHPSLRAGAAGSLPRENHVYAAPYLPSGG